MYEGARIQLDLRGLLALTEVYALPNSIFQLPVFDYKWGFKVHS